jgi:hypothetical protein
VALALILGVVAGSSVSELEADGQVTSLETWRLGWVITALLVVVLLVHKQSQGHYGYLTMRPTQDPHRELALWLNARTQPGESILVGDVGYVGYYNLDRRVYDYLGLVWPASGREMAGVGMPAGYGALVAWAAAKLRPDWIACERAALANHGVPPGYAGEEIPELPGQRCLRAVGAEGR